MVVAGVNRIGSDSGVKVFELADTILGATAGWAFLRPQGAPLPWNISSLIEDFKPTIPPGSSVQAIAALLWTYFNAIYEQHIAQTHERLAAGQSALFYRSGLRSRISGRDALLVRYTDAYGSDDGDAGNQQSWAMVDWAD
jgi:hypothetical protein